MSRLGKSVVALALLSGIAVSGLQPNSPLRRVAAAPRAVMLLQPSLTLSQVVGGRKASLFVHAPAGTDLLLSITYPDGAAASYSGKTDAAGRYTFSWTVPASLQQAGDAELQLHAQRGTRTAEWFGALAVEPAPLPPLFVRPTADRFLAGITVGIFVSTAPDAVFFYALQAAGQTITRGSSVADAKGRAVFQILEPYLPRTQVMATVSVSVRAPNGVSTHTVRVLLLPRPPLPLRVRVASAKIRSGEPLTVSVTSAPHVDVQIVIDVGKKMVAKAGGVTDKAGRWTYTTSLNVPLKHNAPAHITVAAEHGVDLASSHTSFTLQPPQRGILDRLATPSDPTPNLSRFFTQLPDKVILISTEGQSLRVYAHGVLVHEDFVTTGRPELPTPHGVFQVMAKYTPYEFISPWPAGSPFYYPPSWTHYAMLFRDGGYFLHDAPWRRVYGPGTNTPHYTLDPGEPLGTHGCVNLPFSDMLWLWNWTAIGTTVVVY